MSDSHGREILQRLGAAARKTFGEQFWVEQVMKSESVYRARISALGVVISDCRYWSELQAVKEAGGLVVRVNRADREQEHDFCGRYGSEPMDGKCHAPIWYIDGKDDAGADTANMRDCDLPRTSHPTHWTGDTHVSETELPDSGPCYDKVIESSNADETASAVLAWVKERR